MFRFWRKEKKPAGAVGTDRGILVFEHTSDVIRAETLLKKAGFRVRVMGPPPEIRSGCDLVIEYPLIESLDVGRVLETAGIRPLEAVPVTGPLLQPVDLFQVTDFGRHRMVRAANMKITMDRETRVIVNVSGGGCPDVPYLAREMVGRRLDEAPRPRDIGHTLCGYALHLAYENLCQRSGMDRNGEGREGERAGTPMPAQASGRAPGSGIGQGRRLPRGDMPMLAVVGTVPDEGLPVMAGEAVLRGGRLFVDDRGLEIERGTPALLAAACAVAAFFGGPAVRAFLVGDTGPGRGSRKLYEYLTAHLAEAGPGVLTFHYLQPDVDWHNKVLFAVDEITPRPVLIADAGFMYAAKMSGMAPRYDLFTPDSGELAFLADESAPHPFYTRGFILHEDNDVNALIQRAQAHENAAAHLLVKGKRDTVAARGLVSAVVGEPLVPAMEAVGGTGDTLTGVVSGLIAVGRAVPDACLLAARVNRLAGALAGLDPASGIAALIGRIPAALETALPETGRERRSDHD